jgi:hypothetical protein
VRCVAKHQISTDRNPIIMADANNTTSQQQQPAAQQPADTTAAAAPAKQEEPKQQQPGDDSVTTKPDDTAKPAPKAEEPKTQSPQKEKKQAPAQQQQQPAKKAVSRSPSADASRQQPSEQKSRLPTPAEDPFVGMSAIERVRLGYEMAKAKFSSRPSAAFRSRTGREPYRAIATNGHTTPEMKKREQQQQARTDALSKSLHYDPMQRTLPSDFDPNKKEVKRGSSWSRDTSQRRPFAPRYDIIASSRAMQTPGPGTYTSPLAFIGA